VINMSTPKVGYANGKCGRCGHEYHVKRPAPDLLICDCYKVCPLCGSEMTPYTPDLDPATYRNVEAYDVKGGSAVSPDATLETVYVCRKHVPPYYSLQKPVEVRLT